MSAEPRFNVEFLRKIAGEKSFERGEAYFLGNQVGLLAVEAARVIVLVAGTDDYRTVVKGRGRDIGGECSCPAFADWGFCKHMVAVALAANAVDAKSPELGALSRIREYLKRKDKMVLIRMIMSMAERDIDQFSKLARAATIAGQRTSRRIGRVTRRRAD